MTYEKSFPKNREAFFWKEQEHLENPIKKSGECSLERLYRYRSNFALPEISSM